MSSEQDDLYKDFSQHTSETLFEVKLAGQRYYETVLETLCDIWDAEVCIGDTSAENMLKLAVLSWHRPGWLN